MARTLFLALAACLLAAPPLPAWAGGALHGTVTTADGASYTGSLRWDRNENFWDDRLDAAKSEEIYVKNRENTFVFLGLRLPRWGSGGNWTRSSLSIPFGHLQSLEPQGGSRALLELKGGVRLEARAGSTDLGSSMRGLTITEPGGRTVELKWKDIRRVEFSPGADAGLDGRRLYGTVTTRGGPFTGFVVWDRDESLLDDILDARDGGREIEVPFALIARIEREGSRRSRVTTRDGEVMILSGTNDVDSDNRGIQVQVAGLGQVEVPWDEFVALDLAPAPASPGYEAYNGGWRLTGRVRLADGGEASGEVTWDRDETYSWETLDGESAGLSYSIPFERIRSIRRTSRHGAQVTLADGTSMELRGTNDVDETNKGIVVRGPSGQVVEVDWAGFESLDLGPP